MLGGVRDTPEWLLAVKENRIIDTSLRFILHRLYHGDIAEQYSLEYASRMLLNIKLSKDEEIRLTFKQDMKLTSRHLKYAVEDAIVTAMLREVMPKPYATENIHIKGYISLSRIGFDGIAVDTERMEKVRAEFQEEQKEHQKVLNLFGWYPKTPGNSKVVQAILGDVEGHLGISLPKTPKAKTIQLNSDTVDILFNVTSREHPFIKAYNDAQHCQKIVGTYLKDSIVAPDGRVHPHFKPLMKTGRTSCAGPNIQNIPRKGGIRGIYVPKPGHIFFACDYSQAELCSLAETCYLRYGKSVMRDVINEGEDLHRWFGRKIMQASKGSPDDGKDYRQMAKPCNFGFPGGLGAATFQQFAKDYGVIFSRDQCSELKYLWLDAFPEMENHLKPEEDTLHTTSKIIKHDDGTEERVVDNRYIAQTINGRVRKNATYCSACNYAFQGLVADGAKMALWYLYRRGYTIVNFIHDEVIVELPIDDRLQESVKEISSLMIAGMKRVIRNVRIETEGALMYRWYKEAKPKYDNEGNLLIWEPSL
jgi:DNA polymerase-1